MGYLSRKMKIAKKNPGKTGWSSAPVASSDKCDGCKQRFDKMPKAVFEAHVAAAIKDKGCPFPRK
jgi:hypothetical protein